MMGSLWRDKGVARKGAEGDTMRWQICCVILTFIIEIMTTSSRSSTRL